MSLQIVLCIVVILLVLYAYGTRPVLIIVKAGGMSNIHKRIVIYADGTYDYYDWGRLASHSRIPNSLWQNVCTVTRAIPGLPAAPDAYVEFGDFMQYCAISGGRRVHLGQMDAPGVPADVLRAANDLSVMLIPGWWMR